MKGSRQWTGCLEFDSGDRIYADHFPGRAVVPGSLIIAGFLRACRELDEKQGRVRIKQFNFYEFISPGVYDYIINKKDDIFYCMLYNGNKKIASGRIKL